MRRTLIPLLFLALPAAACAGHVESDVLREGSPTAWWRNHKTQVLAQLAQKDADRGPLVDWVGPGKAEVRVKCLQTIVDQVKGASAADAERFWGGIPLWREDVAAIEKHLVVALRDPLLADPVQTGAAWLAMAHDALARNGARRKRLAAFTARPEIERAIVGKLPGESPILGPGDKAIADLVLILQFLRPGNRSFFMNGYTNDALLPSEGYASLYTHIQWDSASIASIHTQAAQVLEEIGPGAVPSLARALDELDDHSKDRGATTPLLTGGLATSTRWSTKEVRFSVAVHPSFRKEAEQLIAKAGGRRAGRGGRTVVTTDVSVGPERAEEVYARHEEDLRHSDEIEEAWVDQNERAAASIVVVAASDAAAQALRARLGSALEGVPLRIVTR